MKESYFKQKKEYTCGPACVRMILNDFGIKKEEKELERELKTNTKRGTLHKQINITLKRYPVKIFTEKESSVKKLVYFIKKGYKIIICYNTKKNYGKVDIDSSHYSVIRKITSKKLYLLDPYYGKNVRYPIEEFEKRWKSTEGKRWFIAVKRRGS